MDIAPAPQQLSLSPTNNSLDNFQMIDNTTVEAISQPVTPQVPSVVKHRPQRTVKLPSHFKDFQMFK